MLETRKYKKKIMARDSHTERPGAAERRARSDLPQLERGDRVRQGLAELGGRVRLWGGPPWVRRPFGVRRGETGCDFRKQSAASLQNKYTNRKMKILSLITPLWGLLQDPDGSSWQIRDLLY